MKYDKSIPDFALQPAKEPEEVDDGFDPSPYDRILSVRPTEGQMFEFGKEYDFPDVEREGAASAFLETEIEERIEEKEEVVIIEEVEEEPIPEAEAEPELEVQAEPELEVQAEIELEVQVEVEPEVQAEIELEVQVEVEPEVQAEIEPEVQAEIEPEVQVEPGPEVQAEPEPEVQAEVEPEAAQTEIEAELETITENELTAEVAVTEDEPAAEDAATENKPADNPIKEMKPAPVEHKPAAIEPTPVAAPPKKDSAKVIPLTGSVMNSSLKITDIKEPPRTKVFIEEDILVPDTKPDLTSILSMDGVAKLSDKEIQVGANGEDKLKVIGEVALQTIYIPDKVEDGQEQIITIQSRIPFKTDWGVSVSPLSHVAVKPIIESVDFTVINERKFRAKITMFLTLREYSDMDVEIFEGIRGEDVQLLKEKIQLTDVAVRKTDVMEINESLVLKETAPVPEKILKYNINIVENHKQIAGEKAVINATVYCNVLYLANQITSNSDGDPDTMGSMDQIALSRKEPYIFQGKTEFTQFIPFASTENPTGSRITFNGSDLTLKIQEEEGLPAAFHLEGNVETSLELYKNVEKEIVTDLYHNEKDITYDFTEVGTMALCGGSVSEISIREILSVPDKYNEAEKVIYIAGRIKDSSSTIEQSKNIVEGIAEITLLCISANEKRTPFKMTQEIPFRGAMEIPGVKQGMAADNEIAIKELWFDKINSKQIEVNAGIFISSSVSTKERHKLIRNVCFVEKSESTDRMPSMIVYIARKGDNLWKIAKKYRTTVDTIKAINHMEQGGQIAPGTKLLIVK